MGKTKRSIHVSQLSYWSIYQIPNERLAHDNNSLEPKGRMQYVETFEVLFQSAINHLVASLQPAKSGARVLLAAIV